MILYRLMRIQAFILGVVLFAALLALGWVMEHASAILRVAGLIVLGLTGVLVVSVVAAFLDLQALKSRDPAAYQEKMVAARQRIEAVRVVNRIQRTAAGKRARADYKRRRSKRRRYRA